MAELADALRAPRGAADELDEARELLAYWEQRARRLPRWALMRRREARAMAWRWRERVRAAEQVRYGRGLLGAASQSRSSAGCRPTLAHRGRQAARIAVYTAVTAAVTLCWCSPRPWRSSPRPCSARHAVWPRPCSDVTALVGLVLCVDSCPGASTGGIGLRL